MSDPIASDSIGSLGDAYTMVKDSICGAALVEANLPEDRLKARLLSQRIDPWRNGQPHQ